MEILESIPGPVFTHIGFRQAVLFQAIQRRKEDILVIGFLSR